MTLGDEIAAALPGLRAEAESMMVDACTVTRSTSGAWNDTTGTSGTATLTTVYSGACRVRMPQANAAASNAGEAEWSLHGAVVSLPVATSGDVRVGDTVTITTATNDAALDGVAFVVKALHWQTNSTARRLSCEAVQRDA